MAREQLRQYQENLLARLEKVKTAGAETSSGYLGVKIADKNVLVSLQDIKETLPIMDIYPVPMVKSWFLGMANVRGVLYAVNDLGQMLENQITVISSNTRIILLNDAIAGHISFMVDRLVGLRKLEELKKIKTAVTTGFCMQADVYEDDENKVWYVMDCTRFAQSDEIKQPY
jgi:twitching motility protein PilI